MHNLLQQPRAGLSKNRGLAPRLKVTTTHAREVKGHDSVTSPIRGSLYLCYSVHKCPQPHAQVTVLWLERVKESVHVNRQVKGEAVFRHQRSVLRGQSKRRITHIKPQYLNASCMMKRLIANSRRSTFTVKKIPEPYVAQVPSHTSNENLVIAIYGSNTNNDIINSVN